MIAQHCCKMLAYILIIFCQSQGILTFDTDNGAKAALKLNGEIWTEDEPKKKKKKGNDTKKESKELRLKVSKVLNRFVTKKQRKS